MQQMQKIYGIFLIMLHTPISQENIYTLFDQTNSINRKYIR